MKKDKRTYVRCPSCGRQPVQVKRGNIVSHLTPGGVRCAWSGIRVEGSVFMPPKQ